MSGLASAGPPVGRLSPTDASVLGLLAEHEVLSTSQLVWLTGVCERTVQHRLGRLAGAGLVGRLRPPVVTGSSPYLCWCTPAGATAVGTETAVPADRSTPRVIAVAALNELWLGLRARAAGGGLNLVCWQRTPQTGWLSPTRPAWARRRAGCGSTPASSPT